jgi:hypothetical protein
MTTYASFEDLTAGADEPETLDVALPSGKVVQVRGLSRKEHLWIGKGTDDAAEIERRILLAGMAQPKLTDAQLKAWQEKPGGSKDVAVVSDAIRDLSGFGEGAQKSHVVADGDGA